MFAHRPAARLRVEALEDRVTPAAGDLDLSFAGDGVAVNPVGAGTSIANDLAIQADGRIVVVGQAYTSSPANVDFAVVRYRPDGSLDPTFGAGGRVTTSFAKFVDEAKDVVIQPDGKILVAGYANLGRTSSGSGRDDAFALARYLPGGALDTTFGKRGLVTTQLAKSAPDSVSAILLRPDGKVLVAGSVGTGDGMDFYLERFLPDGTPDPTFSGDGVILTGFKKGGGARDEVRDIALQPDGKIVAAGMINGLGQWGVSRFNPNGSLDTSFSGDGWLTDPFDKRVRDEWANAVAVQPDGRIVVGGSAHRAATGRDWVAARYTAGGTLDSTFGTGGKAWVDFGPESGVAWSPETQYVDLALAPGGQVVLAGESSGDRLGVARLTAAGALDPTFAGDGRLLTVPTGWTTIAPNDDYNVAIQPDGRIVVTANRPGSETAVGRLNADGAADTSFDDDGWKTFRFDPNGSSAINDVLLQPDGKIVVAGRAWIDGLSLLALARFNPNGTFDDAP